MLPAFPPVDEAQSGKYFMVERAAAEQSPTLIKPNVSMHFVFELPSLQGRVQYRMELNGA